MKTEERPPDSPRSGASPDYTLAIASAEAVRAGRIATFAVTLPAPRDVLIRPTSSGGTVAPSVLAFSPAVGCVMTFDVIPTDADAELGLIEVATTNDGGLVDPPPGTFVVHPCPQLRPHRTDLKAGKRMDSAWPAKERPARD